MKTFLTNIICIISIFLLSNCVVLSRNYFSTVPQDSIELTKLVRHYLKWSETNFEGDFWPTTTNPSDTLYSGIDWTNQNHILKTIEKSKLFTAGFLDNFQKIALQIDAGLKSGKIIWYVGDLPDFGPGSGEANAWCNCQDRPDNYLEKMTISNLDFAKDNATFQWSWGDDLSYHVKAKKVNGNWLIDYLQGFDIKNYH